MKKIALIVAVLLVACTSNPDTPVTDTTHAVVVQPIMDSTVQRKAAPDTLVRGDGAKCVVRPAAKWTSIEIGQLYPCNWSK